MNVLDRFLRPECHRVRQVLQSFLDGELDERHADIVAAHLQHCERCGIEADLYERVKDSLAELRPGPPVEVLARLREFADTVPRVRPDEHPDD